MESLFDLELKSEAHTQIGTNYITTNNNLPKLFLCLHIEREREKVKIDLIDVI